MVPTVDFNCRGGSEFFGHNGSERNGFAGHDVLVVRSERAHV